MTLQFRRTAVSRKLAQNTFFAHEMTRFTKSRTNKSRLSLINRAMFVKASSGSVCDRTAQLLLLIRIVSRSTVLLDKAVYKRHHVYIASNAIHGHTS